LLYFSCLCTVTHLHSHKTSISRNLTSGSDLAHPISYKGKILVLTTLTTIFSCRLNFYCHVQSLLSFCLSSEILMPDSPLYLWSSWCYIYLKTFWLYSLLYLLLSWIWWDWPLTWLSKQCPSCFDTVGWVIWPVKSSQKWPIMCRVGH